MNARIVIRSETDADIGAITDVTVAAFNTLAISHHTEQFIIEALRAASYKQAAPLELGTWRFGLRSGTGGYMIKKHRTKRSIAPPPSVSVWTRHASP